MEVVSLDRWKMKVEVCGVELRLCRIQCVLCSMLRAGWPRRWSRLMQPIKEEASWTCTMSCAKQGVA